MVHASQRCGEFGNYNGPKVDHPETCPGAAPSESDLGSAAGYLLETPSIRRYSLDRASDNPSGADNQQERPTSQL